MAAIRSRNTKPEMAVRRAVHAAGFRFRLHRRDLPGRPDLVLPRYRHVVLVHGCFWHLHGCAGMRAPRFNSAYWHAKLALNVARDDHNRALLEERGWQVTIVWECSLAADLESLLEQLREKRATHNITDLPANAGGGSINAER